MINKLLPPLFFGFILGFAWFWFEHLYWLNFIGFAFPFYWLKQKRPFSEKLSQALIFLLPWFAIGGFWLNSYSFNLYLFGVGIYTLLYLVPLLISLLVSQKLAPKFHAVSFIISLLAVEYIQESFHPFVPWFNIGNGFAASNSFNPILQFFGLRGLSIFVLLIAWHLFKLYDTYSTKNRRPNVSLIYLLPFVGIYFFSPSEIELRNQAVLFIQPHKTPSQKFEFSNLANGLKSLNLKEVDFAIAPESFYDETVNDDFEEFSKIPEFFQKEDISFYFGFIKKAPYKNLILNQGFDTLYQKQKPVPVVESNFLKAAPSKYQNASHAICSESTYSNLLRNKAQNSEGLIIVHTNDVWFENTSAFKQHAYLLKLRAIETGKTVVRVANSGISGIFFPNGRMELIEKNKLFVVKEITPSSISTSFSKNGDILGRLTLLITPFLILYAITMRKQF